MSTNSRTPLDHIRNFSIVAHIDHGKSTLIRALTGIEPDRLAEEERRGLTIDLGFAWTALPSGREVSFVDVPGHERFLGNMLAGLGPAPVVCFVVAVDEGWQAQSGDHREQQVAALAVACSELAARAPATESTLAQLAAAAADSLAVLHGHTTVATRWAAATAVAETVTAPSAATSR